MTTHVSTAGKRSLPTKTVRYSDSGEMHERHRKEHADKATIARVLMVITTVVGIVLDFTLYKPISDRIVYNNNDFANTVVCLFLSATPIVSAWALAHLVARIRHKITRKTWHIIAAVGVLVLTACLLAFTCWLRLTGADPGKEDHLVYAWALNFLAILITVISFVIHLFLTIKHDKHSALADKNRLQRDYSELIGEAKQYTQVSHRNKIRTDGDYESYCNTYRNELPDLALGLMDTARTTAANLYAKSPEQFRQVQSFPKQFGNKVYNDRASAKSALHQLCEAPQQGAQHHPYGSSAQNTLLDDEAQEVTDDLDKRYRAIINS